MIDLADDLDKEIKNMLELIRDTQQNWIGPASIEYQRHFINLTGDILDTKTSMYGVANDIKSIATRIQQEDERQAELARQMLSGGD